jgi:hypothetical protein
MLLRNQRISMPVNTCTAGWLYILAHPAWDKIGMVKIGKTGRDPRTRAREITSVSGLITPCTIVWCAPVSDMAAAEKAVHRMLDRYRVTKRREMFRISHAQAKQAAEAIAQSLQTNPTSARQSFAAPRYYQRRRPSRFARACLRAVGICFLIITLKIILTG